MPQKTSRRPVVFFFLLAAFGSLTAAPIFAANEGRVRGVVTDETGAPLAGAKISVSSPDFKFHLERTSDAQGKFLLIILDISRKYVIHLEKEGYASFEAPLDLKLGEDVKPIYQLPRQQPQAASAPQIAGSDQAILTFNEGVQALKTNDLPAAAAKFEAAVGLDPKLAPAHGALAEVYLVQKRYGEAAAQAEAVLSIEPTNARALSARYDAYQGLGDKTKAAAALAAMTQALPGHDTALRVFNQAAEALRGGQKEAAIAGLKNAIELDHTLTPAYSALASIYLSQKSYRETLAIIEQWLQADPGSRDALSARLQAYKGLGDKAKVKEATAALQASTAAETPASLFSQGVTLFNANNLGDARTAFERVLAADPNHAKAHYMMGLVLANSGENAAAKEHLRKFLELAPADPDAGAAKEMLKAL